MKRTLEKTLSLALAMLLCLSMLPLAALASDEAPVTNADPEAAAAEAAGLTAEEGAEESPEPVLVEEEPAAEPPPEQTEEEAPAVTEVFETDAEPAGVYAMEETVLEEDILPLDDALSLDGATTPSNVNIAQAQARLEALTAMFKGKYFTVNGSACTTGSHSGCSNCLASSVIATSWVKNLVGMGTMSASLFPAQYFSDGTKGSANGDSCYGFANFAHWYIFAQRNTDNLVSTLVARGSMTYATLKKALPGDVIRTSNTHSMVFISCNSSGFTVLDCNYKSTATGNTACQVKVHTMSYSSSVTVAITGVTNYTRTNPTYTIAYNANGGSGAPSSQTKTYGTALTLSTTVPSRTGYSFLGWSTSSTAASASYAAGGSYTANSAATLYAVWKANSYTVAYDANGGSGAPSSQTKTYGTALTLSTTVPSRTGYSFLGWSTSSTAASAAYAAGGSYTANSGATLYAVWKEDAPVVTGKPTLVVSSETTSLRGVVSVTVSIENNPGISMMILSLNYDSTVLGMVNCVGSGLTGWETGGRNAIWLGEEDSSYNGVILTMNFEVLETAQYGETAVSVSYDDGDIANFDEETVSFEIQAGKVIIQSSIPGDITSDGIVNGMDLLRLKKYLAGYSVTIEAASADVTGDGVINGMDLLRLKKYLAGYDVVLL